MEFQLIRDVSKARVFPEDSGLQVSRHATLSVIGESGLLGSVKIVQEALDLLEPRHRAVEFEINPSHEFRIDREGR